MRLDWKKAKDSILTDWVYKILLAGCCISLTTTVSSDQTPSVEQIVDRTEQATYYQGRDGRARVSMVITDKQGRNRRRNFTILRWDRAGREGVLESNRAQKYYVHLQRPADVRNTVFMVWKERERDDDRWLYLPALDLVKRIAAGDKRTSFLGSDFFYEDISGRSTHEDTHELVELTDDYFILKNTPKNPASVEFSYYMMWVHRNSFIPVRVEYFNTKGVSYRVYDALEVSAESGYQTVVKSRMRDARNQSETILNFSRVRYDIDLPENIFSERYLRNPPIEYLQ